MSSTKVLSAPADAPATGSAESHENEGFLKSLWHKVTDHPAHREDATKNDTVKKDGSQTKKDEKDSSK